MNKTNISNDIDTIKNNNETNTTKATNNNYLINNKLKTQNFDIEGMSCASCAMTIEKKLKSP